MTKNFFNIWAWLYYVFGLYFRCLQYLCVFCFPFSAPSTYMLKVSHSESKKVNSTKNTTIRGYILNYDVKRGRHRGLIARIFLNRGYEILT